MDSRPNQSQLDRTCESFIRHTERGIECGHLPYSILFNQGGPSLTLSTPLVLSTPADTGNTWTPTSVLRSIEASAVGIPRWNVFFTAGNPHLDDLQTSLPGFENSIDLSANAEWFTGFLDSSITGCGYWGHAWLSPTATSSPFHRAGAFFNIYGSHTKGTIGYVGGSDRAISGRNLGTSGGFALVEYLVNDQWSTYFRYDWFGQDLDAGGAFFSTPMGLPGGLAASLCRLNR